MPRVSRLFVSVFLFSSFISAQVSQPATAAEPLIPPLEMLLETIDFDIWLEFSGLENEEQVRVAIFHDSPERRFRKDAQLKEMSQLLESQPLLPEQWTKRELQAQAEALIDIWLRHSGDIQLPSPKSRDRLKLRFMIRLGTYHLHRSCEDELTLLRPYAH